MDEEKNGNTADPRPGGPEGAGSGESNPQGSSSSDGSGIVASPENSPEVLSSPQEGESLPAAVPEGVAGLEVPAHPESVEVGMTPVEASPLPLVPEPVPEHDPMHIKIAVYDGPLDLLIDLIKKNEMNVYDIPVAEITRQYLDYLKIMKQLDLEVAGEFIVMAATLIYIKSKLLLPTDKDEEEGDGEDPRAELVRKLLEYQAFKEAAKELGLLQTERGKMFTRQITDYYLGEMDAEDAGVDTFSANFFDLIVAFQNVLAKKEPRTEHEVFEEVVSIEEKMIQIQSHLDEKGKVSFNDLFSERWTRNELIATFLAVLEIVRTRFAWVRQDKQFGEIVIEKRNDN